MTLAERLDAVPPGTVGLEEEVLLLDPDSHAPSDRTDAVLARLGPAAGVKREMPVAQVELVTGPHPTVAGAVAELAQLRGRLLAAADGLAVPAAAAVHPTAPLPAALNGDERYRPVQDAHRTVAGLQLVGALHVHVAVGGAARTLATHNALRSVLPELVALSAAAPFLAGRDTGLATVRPLVCGLLPRQGVPPAIESWDAFEADLAWGAFAPRQWWWELRPHRTLGTLELRVPDVQPTLVRTAAVASVAVALVRALAAAPPADPAPTWRIEENRWAALRDGLDATLHDLVTGAARPARQRLAELLDRIEPHADGPLDRSLLERTAADELRAAGLPDATRWLTAAFSG